MLGVSLAIPGQERIDALMDAVTQLQAHGMKVKDVLEEAATVLGPLYSRFFPGRPIPSTAPGIVQAFLEEEDPLREYGMNQTQSGAKAAVQFALASGIEGDFEKAYSDIPRKPDSKKVALKPFAARAGKLAEMLS